MGNGGLCGLGTRPVEKPGSLRSVTFGGVLAFPGLGRVSQFHNPDVVITGLILIGVIGFGIDLLMRWAERILVSPTGRA